MDPVTLSLLGLGVGGAGSILGGAASVYGANLQDNLNRDALAYQKKRDALGDQRQARQDTISEEDRKRRIILEKLAMAEQERRRAASQWHPSMAQSTAQPVQPQAVG